MDTLPKALRNAEKINKNFFIDYIKISLHEEAYDVSWRVIEESISIIFCVKQKQSITRHIDFYDIRFIKYLYKTIFGDDIIKTVFHLQEAIKTEDMIEYLKPFL